ncbi:hypothetical protein FLAG1_06905 [Fusarium langsethiae]|uniref:Uncharacterized protein n=1 Tax=Fusarium langsethiae TaxID=179993 RepID=A0A0N0DDW4_FUSLA|nr:hypothetical protein FLAG1_06905 [Fusarium langsethiae]GKU04303.1 unnamed protein product [Fusarium langsethiae]GKU19631.1 unnamed protein product [Fusarium langsethiae]
MPPKQLRKRKPAASQTSSQRRRRAATVIPSTPISQSMPSSQAAKKRRVDDGNERIAETPQANKRRAMGSKGQQTPERITQLAQATSPSTPFEVSSAESSDSDCKINKVLPSPKRKLVAAGLRARPAKKAKMERSVTPSSGDESDCVIEKVLPSSKRHQAAQQKANIKRRRVGDSLDSPVCIESDVDSDAEDVNSLPELIQTQTPDEPRSRSHSPHIADPLLALLDAYQSRKAASEAAQQTSTPVIRNSPPDVPFSTAPELPIQDSSPMESPSREVQTQEAQVEDAPISPASNLENNMPSSTYKLQPVYSGENLQETHTPGTPTQFRPDHRESLIGLKSILKRSSEKPVRDINQETEITAFPDISPLSGDEHVISSPTERIQDSKHQAKIIRPSLVSFARKLVLADLRPKDWKPPQFKNTHRPLTPLPKPSPWLRQKKELKTLASITNDTAAEDAVSDQETPSKPPTERINRTTQKLVKVETQSSDENDSGDERPDQIEEVLKSGVGQETPSELPTQPAMRQTRKQVKVEKKYVTDVRVSKAKHHKLAKQLKQSTKRQVTHSKPQSRKSRGSTRVDEHHVTDAKESEGGHQKKFEVKQPVLVPSRNWYKPLSPGKEMMPQVIRDSVSEHAIKPTVAAFEKKSAAGQGFTFKNNDSNERYNWDVDWNTTHSLSERKSRAVASELEHRGIRTEKQYSNFWYNLTMKLSSVAGSPVPLFTAKKKALETFVEEAMCNDHDRQQKSRKEAAKKKLLESEKKKKKHKKTKNRSRAVEKVLAASDTDEEKRKKTTKKLPQGVDAFLIPGDTDEEDKSSSEDSDYDGEDLMAKVRADIDRQRRISGGGTSCGYRKGDL